MKEAGVSSLEILDIITNQYTDLPKVRTLSTSEVYENLEGDKIQAINDLAKSDPLEAKRLVDYYKRLKSIEQRNLSAKDKLILGLDVEQRVKYLRSVGADRSRAVLNEYIRKGIATKSVVQALEQ
jgi:Leucine-rich repeat (LRR) protein